MAPNTGGYRRVMMSLSVHSLQPPTGGIPSWRPAIEQALFEHYEPYGEAVIAGELPAPSEARRIAVPGDVWSHVSLVFVSVTPLSGLLTTELGYATAWDDEHTLGARFQSGNFIELCGSVLRP